MTLARDVVDFYSMKLFRWFLIEPSRIISNSWKLHTMLVTTLSRHVPASYFYYGLQVHESCKCCGGDICLKIHGHVAYGFCHHAPDDTPCKYYDRKMRACNFPGKSCRGTPEDRFTGTGKNWRLWLAFKAFNTIEIACRRGWCSYEDGGYDFDTILQLVRDCGLPVVKYGDNDDKSVKAWIGKPGSTSLPGSMRRHHIMRGVARLNTDDWRDEVLEKAFSRIMRKFMERKRARRNMPLPDFTCLLYYR